MARPKKVDTKPTNGSQSKARTEAAREKQMIALAINLAEQQLRDGTASSQVITHFLKLGSSTERVDKELKQKKKELLDAQTENLQSAKRIEALYADAIAAMQRYSGNAQEGGSEEDDEQD